MTNDYTNDNRSTLGNVREQFQIGSSQRLPLVVGILIGLALGLLIGWGLWPVEWQNAILADLNPTAKANYLAAVADAYVANRDPEAAQDAVQRLGSLNENLAAEIEAAQTFFTDNPQSDSGIRYSNLELLKTVLVDRPLNTIEEGTELSEAADGVPDSVPAVGEALNLAAPENAETADSVITPDSSSLQGWRLWLVRLTALLLVLGGGYILWAVLGRDKLDVSATIRSFLDNFSQNGGNSDKTEDGDRRRRMGIDRASSSPQDISTADSFGAHTYPTTSEEQVSPFDEEPDDFEQWSSPYSPKPSIEQSQVSIDDNNPSWNRQTPLEGFEDDPLWPEEPPMTEATDFEESRGPNPARFHQSGRVDEQQSSGIRPPFSVPTSSLSEPEPPVAVNKVATSFPKSTRQSKQLISEYIARYQIGISDYDESQNVLRPDGESYIGEYGMGINIKNGVLQNAPEHVVALDVWLFDKSDETSLRNQTRVLLSEYAVNHNLEDTIVQASESGLGALVPQPGLTFELEGESLLLNCKVVDVAYAHGGEAEGVFQKLEIKMMAYWIG